MNWNLSKLGYTANSEVLQADCHHIDARGHERKTFFDKSGDYLVVLHKRNRERKIARDQHDRWLRNRD